MDAGQTKDEDEAGCLSAPFLSLPLSLVFLSPSSSVSLRGTTQREERSKGQGWTLDQTMQQEEDV